MKQRKRNGLLPPIRTSDVLVFSSRREPFHRRDDGRVARRPSPRRVRTRTPMFKRMARRLKAMRMLERGMRFAAAPRRLEAAYEDEMDAEHMEPVEEEEEKEREETPEGSDDDGEPEDDDHPASSSDSDEVQITGEVAATPPPRGTAPLTPDTAIAFAQRALHLTLKRERGHGNCMFCAFSSGLNSWLDAGELATSSWREYVKPGSNEREDPSTLHGKVTGSNRGGIQWSHLRAALVQALKQTVRDAKKRDRDRVMNELCAGEEGRAWLHRGKFASALPYERFHAHLEVMSKDAAPHSGRSRWTRFWGTDVEVTALAAALGVACVVVECDESRGTGRSPYYLAVPAHVAEAMDPIESIENAGGTKRKMRPGRYMPHGEWVNSGKSSKPELAFEPSNRGAGRTQLCVRAVKAGSRRAAAASEGRWGGGAGVRRYIPAIVVIHRPGHFDSLQPAKGTVLVLERTVV